MIAIDEFGRLVEATSGSGDRLVLTGPARGPIVPPMPAAPRPRSPKWPAFLKRFLQAHPACAGCGRRAETGHHVEPFHRRPDLELVPANVVAVCVPCHFCLCHAGAWNLTVPTCREVLAAHLPVVRAAVVS